MLARNLHLPQWRAGRRHWAGWRRRADAGGIRPDGGGFALVAGDDAGRGWRPGVDEPGVVGLRWILKKPNSPASDAGRGEGIVFATGTQRAQSIAISLPILIYFTSSHRCFKFRSTQPTEARQPIISRVVRCRARLLDAFHTLRATI